MSDVNDKSESTESTESTDQTLVGKAKQAASDIDVREIADRAKDAATDVRNRVTTFVGEREGQIGDAIERTGHFVDEKLTKQRFSDKIDKAQEAAKSAVTKVGQSGDGDTAGEAGSPTSEAGSPTSTG